jgi:hypothetical protein
MVLSEAGMLIKQKCQQIYLSPHQQIGGIGSLDEGAVKTIIGKKLT